MRRKERLVKCSALQRRRSKLVVDTIRRMTGYFVIIEQQRIHYKARGRGAKTEQVVRVQIMVTSTLRTLKLYTEVVSMLARGK